MFPSHVLDCSLPLPSLHHCVSMGIFTFSVLDQSIMHFEYIWQQLLFKCIWSHPIFISQNYFFHDCLNSEEEASSVNHCVVITTKKKKESAKSRKNSTPDCLIVNSVQISSAPVASGHLNHVSCQAKRSNFKNCYYYSYSTTASYIQIGG